MDSREGKSKQKSKKKQTAQGKENVKGKQKDLKLPRLGTPDLDSPR